MAPVFAGARRRALDGAASAAVPSASQRDPFLGTKQVVDPTVVAGRALLGTGGRKGRKGEDEVVETRSDVIHHTRPQCLHQTSE